MLRNYPVKTIIGFIIWFAAAALCCAFIGHPIIRIISYTSLIFFGVIQGWSIMETHKQEAENGNSLFTTVSLSGEKAKNLKIAAFTSMTVALALGCWASSLEGITPQLIIAVFFIALLFIVFRLDRLKELQTAREIAMGTSFMALVFVILLPLYFNVNYLAICLTSLGTYIASIGQSSTPQKTVRLSLTDFKTMSKDKDFFAPSAQEAYEWYDVYPYIAVVNKKGKHFAGYISLVPLKNDTASAFRDKGSFDRLELSDIMNISLMKPAEPKTLLLSSLHVKDKYSNENIREKLLYDALIQYEDVFDCISSVLISEEGALKETDFDSFKNSILN